MGILRIYSSIHKEFISNSDGILQDNFHLKSSFYKTKYILTRVFGNVMVINFIVGFQILRLFCATYWRLL